MLSLRNLAVATLTVCCALVAMLTLAGGSALAALETTYLRNSPITFVNEAFDATGNIYNPEGAKLEKYDSTDAPAEYSGSGLAPYINGASLTGTPEGPFGAVASVAIAANGDIYVIDSVNKVVNVFEPTGIFIEKWTGANTPSKAFAELKEVQVDTVTGDVYVLEEFQGTFAVDVFDGTGKYLRQISATSLPSYTKLGNSTYPMVVDDLTGDVLVADVGTNGGETPIYEFGPTGSYITTWNGTNTPAKSFYGFTKMTVDQATGEVLVTDREKNVIDVFDSSGQYLTPEITGAEQPESVGIDEATGEIYISGNKVHTGLVENKVFSSVVVPDVFADSPSNFSPEGTTLTLNGTVDGGGHPLTSCHFEYGIETSYGQEMPCSPSPVGETTKVSVSADLTGLQPDTLYHFRVDAADGNGANFGQDAQFFTSTKPLVEGGYAAGSGSTEEPVSGQIDPAGLSSTYRVEYGSSAETGFGSSTLEAGLGVSESAVPVLARLENLKPNTEYHFRFVASNALGTTFGSIGTFKTSGLGGASTSALPDNRVFELVSSLGNGDNDTYIPEPENPGPLGGEEEFLNSERPMQASLDGNAIVYIADPVPGGSGSNGNGHGNEFLASRIGGGRWTSTIITPSALQTASGTYQGFSNDLSVGIFGTNGSETIPGGPTECTALISRTTDDGKYHPLFTKSAHAGEACFSPRLSGISQDGSHIVFEMPTALTQEAPGQEVSNIYDYESQSGRLNLINVLPESEGGAPAGNAKLGSSSNTLPSNAVSKDGSRVFWTDLTNGNLYMRENSGAPTASTVLIAAGGEYWTANADGSLVFFTKNGDLYAFDVEDGHTSDLAPGGEVQGVVGASEDGSYVYFVGLHALTEAGGELLENRRGEMPVEQEENLYAYHAGITKFITTLAQSDSNDWLFSGGGGSDYGTPEWESPYRSAEVASNGQGVVFTSTRGLTDYDNQSANEVYVYSAETEMVSCASCSPTNQPPVAGGGFLSPPTGLTHLPRWINEEGSEVFFDSAEPLVPQAVGGKVQVYEWERNEAGSCHQSEGCLYLLSAGTGAKESFFVDASASGSDVFFVTRARLVVQDESDNAVLYDARVDGYRPVTAPLCSSTGCQGVPPAPPIFATPSSVTFSGVGNFETPTTVAKTRPRAKTTTCKKGFVKKKGRCVKRPKLKHKKARKSGKRSTRGSK